MLAYHPLVRGNPFQAMLYGACADHGLAPVALGSLDALVDVRALVDRGVQVWLHLHWTQTVLARARSAAEARSCVEAFERRLDALRRDGGRIAWTVHNVLPHEERFSDEEANVCRAIAERADLVHVMGEATLAATKPFYLLPEERVRIIPHSSYIGVYPDYLSGAQARADLGFRAEDTVLGFIGKIRPYKRVDRLLAAFETVAREERGRRLLVAGQLERFAESERLGAHISAQPGVVAHLERMHDQDVQRYVRACDVIVLPYEEILNSGVVMLAFSFGRPVIAPSRGCVAELVTPDVGITFDPSEPAGLERALRRASELKHPRYREAARRRAEDLPPIAMSEAFCASLRDADAVE